MAEKVQLAAKTSKTKENSASTTRKIESPQSISSPADQVLYLQRTIGNQAVQRLIKSGALHAKLKIGQPGDMYEQEADRVADEVMRMPEPQVQRQPIGEEEEEQIQTKPVIEQISPLVQRQVEEEEEEEELRRQSIEDVEEVQTKTTSDLIPEVQPNIEYHFLSLKGGGQPLSESDRAFFEPRFGRDFSQVRVHTDSQAAETAQAVNARAYTMGRDVVFGTGQYAPETNAGKGLLAHELTHLVQRGLDSSSNKIQRVVENDITRMSITKDWAINLNDAELEGQINIVRDQLLTLDPTTPEYTAARQNLRILEAEATLRLRLQGTKVEEYGIAYKKEGVNLRDQPASNPDSKVLVRLQFNSRMYIDSVVDGYYFVGTDDGQFGYVATTHVKLNLPEPDAKIYHIEAGDTALGISRQHYGGEAKWGRDHRFFVNGLVYINRGTGERGIYKPDAKADWDTTEVRAGYMIWVPSLKFMRSLQGIVKSESITYEAWQTVKDVATAVGEFLLGTGAFVVGLLHGALESVWDIFVGLKDLAVMAWDLVKWLFGLITGDSKGLFDSLKGINWGELVQGWIDDFVAKWDNESILKRWHFRGWVIGYAIAEVLMLIFSGGIIQGIKWVGKSAKVAKVISKLPKIAKLAESAKASKAGQKFLKVLQATKGTLGAATKTVKKVVLSGGRIAVKGFIFAAKGIYRVGGKILRGTWSVAEKTIGKVAKKLYYFYDDAAKVLKLIRKKIANIFIKCTNCYLTKTGKAETIEEFVARGGKIEKLPPGPKPSKFAEELEELLIGSKGESMFGSDPVLRNLLAVKGTFTHATFNRLAMKLKQLMPENSLFLPKDWSGLEKVLGKRLPWKRGHGPDLILVDRTSKKIAIVDLTRKSSPSHIKKTLDYASDFKKLFPDWDIPPSFVRDIYYGGSKTVRQVIDEQIKPLLIIFGGKG